MVKGSQTVSLDCRSLRIAASNAGEFLFASASPALGVVGLSEFDHFTHSSRCGMVSHGANVHFLND